MYVNTGGLVASHPPALKVWEIAQSLAEHRHQLGRGTRRGGLRLDRAASMAQPTHSVLVP